MIRMRIRRIAMMMPMTIPMMLLEALADRETKRH
jgi:hypothetical protein